jgi:hypothetical protein
MKNLTFFILSIIIALTISCSDETTSEDQLVTLTQQEKEDLLFLREEEKLARDVYLFSFDIYGDGVFNNIAASEQQHMDAVLALLNKYGLSDPASSEIGVFKDPILQGLYNQLTTVSKESLLNALTVGATIEDLDINDISIFESGTTKADLLNVYDILKCGSGNHLRSFPNRLTFVGLDYSPEYLSLEAYNAILTSERERCGR